MPYPSCFSEGRSGSKLQLSALCTVLVASTFFSGCSLVYKNRLSGRVFTLYTDRDEEFLSRVGAKVSQVSLEYQGLFQLSREDLGSPSLVFRGGESGVVDYGERRDPLGYYLPFFGYIQIETGTGLLAKDELLDQVLLHEMAHHFTLRKFPAAAELCWLNEGLACALEVSVFDGKRFEYPLLNPILFQIARRAACSRSSTSDLAALLTMTHTEFHEASQRERNYALAWSLVYFLLEVESSTTLSLSERIDRLCTRDPSSMPDLESRWHDFLRGFDVTGHLVKMAAGSEPDSSLTARWAARRLGDVPGLDGHRALEGLSSLIDVGDTSARIAACTSFLSAWERYHHSFFLESERIRRALERIRATLTDPEAPTTHREAIVTALESSSETHSYWARELVALLEADEIDLRVAAATTLAGLGPKPTVANPAFWRSAPREDRRCEVLEWRLWLLTQHGPALALP